MRFAEDRVHREWFVLSDHLRRYIVARLSPDGIAAFRQAENDFIATFLPVEDKPRRKWKRPLKRCHHGNPLMRSCSKCTKEADLKVYEALRQKLKRDQQMAYQADRLAEALR
ncbi:hypothetical protein [Bradyrhizobium genosp. L]|uniref:hypothetical protein n=1 Tax=Bradyrhizobium genosp. L TaxID=83637 RepID=UPI001FED6AA8|nr:hypothetical protein [Bradyrhizobium genosp. L]